MNINNSVDSQYFDLLNHILNYGVYKSDRTNTGVLSIFGHIMRFNMSDGFPILTSKKMYFKGIVHELIWFLNGNTNIKYLVDNNVNIWVGDAYKNYERNVPDKYVVNDLYEESDIKLDMKVIKNSEMYREYVRYTKNEFIEKIKNDNIFSIKWGEMGPIYGKQWRNWGGYIDQIKKLIYDLKTNPDSRRLLVSSWNVGELDNMILPPCHFAFQCYTRQLSLYERRKIAAEKYKFDILHPHDLNEDHLDDLNIPKRRLSLQWYQRSVDVMLGLPFNISSYALLLALIAKEVNMIPDELIFVGGDVHIYSNHIKYAKLQLTRKTYDLPQLVLKNDSIFNLKYDDVILINYNCSDPIKMEICN